MNRFYYLLMVIGILFGVFIPPQASAATPVYPIGLKGPADVASGLYPGTDAGNCCWMGKNATLRASIPDGADTLLLNVYLPKFAAPPNGQTLRVQIGNGAALVRCCLGAGEHELAVPLGEGRHRAIVQLRAGTTFVPKAIGLNDDPRQLSIMLRGVAFENASTGERFDTGALPWMPPRIALALLGVAGIVIFLLTLRGPIWGVATLILTAPFLLAYSVHDTTLTLPKVALIAVLAGLIPHLRRMRGARAWYAVTALAAAQVFFILSMAAAIPHAAFHGAASRETLKAVQYALTLLVAYTAFRMEPDEKAVRACLSILTIVVTLLALAQLFGGAMESEIIAGHAVTRIAGPLEGPNQLSGFLGVVLPAMLAFALYRPPIVIERVAIVLGVVTCLMTFSRGGVAALLVAMVAMIAIRRRAKWRGAIGPVVAAVFAIVLALAFGVFTGALHGRVQSLFGATGDNAFNGGLGSRIDLWHGAFAMWRSRPLFGIGPGNFEYAIGRFDPGVRTHANSMYFQVLAEQGLAGLISIFAVIAASIGVFLRRLNGPLALGACAAAVAMAFHQIVDCLWLYPKVGVIWWIVLALGAAAVDLHDAAESVTETAVA